MFKRRPTEQPLRLFYAGDVHGSRVCWKKFVNAAAHYPADALVMGGDLTGKALVPIVREGDGSYSARVIGERREARTAEELDQMQRAISTNGMYPLIVDPEEARAAGRPTPPGATRPSKRRCSTSCALWVEFADERLAGTDSVAYVIPGNDDPWSIDEVLASGTSVDACDEAVRMVGAARDGLLRLLQPDALADPARARRGGDLLAPEAVGRPAREAGAGDLQHPRPALREQPRHRLSRSTRNSAT